MKEENGAGEKGVVEEMRKRGQRMDGLSEDKKRETQRRGQRWRDRVNRRCKTLLSALANTRESADICTRRTQKKKGKRERQEKWREGGEKKKGEQLHRIHSALASEGLCCRRASV